MSGLDDWTYYNYAAIPNTAPHVIPDLSPIYSGSIWNLNGNHPFLARYTTEFDCGIDTGWYYTIKDSCYDLSRLPSKKRYNITKGRKNFYVKRIDPRKYASEIAEIQEDAFEGYSDYNHIYFSKQDCINTINEGGLDSLIILGAFSRETDKLCGFYSVKIENQCIFLVQLKVFQSKEKQRINYALIDGVLTTFSDYQKKGYYFSNGCRNLNHHTNFNELLCENFGFRKAYCKLHMVYPWYVKLYVYILYLFRRYIGSIKTKHSFFYKINAVLQMEDIARKCGDMK